MLLGGVSRSALLLQLGRHWGKRTAPQWAVRVVQLDEEDSSTGLRGYHATAFTERARKKGKKGKKGNQGDAWKKAKKAIAAQKKLLPREEEEEPGSPKLGNKGQGEAWKKAKKAIAAQKEVLPRESEELGSPVDDQKLPEVPVRLNPAPGWNWSDDSQRDKLLEVWGQVFHRVAARAPNVGSQYSVQEVQSFYEDYQSFFDGTFVAIQDQETVERFVQKLNDDDLARDFCKCVYKFRTNIPDVLFSDSQFEGPSMLPTIDGGWSFARNLDSDSIHSIQREDVVCFLAMRQPQLSSTPNDVVFAQAFTKRVAALPGDTVEFKGNLCTCPPGHFWALGDNPDYSLDSRQFGAVPLVNMRTWELINYSFWPPFFKILVQSPLGRLLEVIPK